MSHIPPLSPEEQTHCLAAEIRKSITKQGGLLSFADFMAQALYHPTLGYYQTEHRYFGDDFRTAPEISPLFAQCLATECRFIFAQLPAESHTILEVGAGSGRLAADLLHALTEQPGAQQACLVKHYYLVEPSPALRRRQQALLQAICPGGYDRCVFLETMPAYFSGIMIANEVIDALPVHRFLIEEGHIKEGYVTIEHDQFALIFDAPQHGALVSEVTRLQKEYGLSSPYQSEVRFSPLVTKLANHLRHGMIIIIDYGYGEANYYHAARYQGTLACFYRHDCHENPLINIGCQDITAHVNFTAVLKEAMQAKCQLVGFNTQAAFLLTSGLVDYVTKQLQSTSLSEQFKLSQAIKYLTFPTEMGERIKVMALKKNFPDYVARPWCQQDRRREL